MRVNKHQSCFLRYLVALLLPVTAAWLGMARPAIGEMPFFVFLGAVIVSARYGGLMPACISAAFSIFLLRLLFVQPAFSLAVTQPDGAEQLALFALLSLAGASLVAGLRTDRNLARQREEAYRLLADRNNDAVLLLDDDGHIVMANSAAEGVLGAGGKRLVGEKLDRVLCPEAYQSCLAEVRRNEDHRKPAATRQFWSRLLSGQRGLLELSLAPVARENDELVAVVVRHLPQTDPSQSPLC